MAAPDASWIDALPVSIQYIVQGAIGIATLVGGVLVYMRNKSKGDAHNPSNPDNLALPMVQIADMQPVRELAAQMKRQAEAGERTADALERQVEILEKRAMDEEVDRKVRERLERARE